MSDSNGKSDNTTGSDGKSKARALAAPSNPLVLLRSQYAEQKYNLLLPVVHVGSLPIGTQLSVREVRIDTRSIQGAKRTEFPGGEVYAVEGKLGLGKVAINKIAAAAGITWEYSHRVDDRSDPYYCEFEVRAKVTDFDGTVRYETSSKTLDLREGGKDVNGISDRQLDQMRKFIAEHCETKAKNRAVRAILSLKTSYQAEELQKPFIVPKLIPDTTDPMAQKAVLANMYGASQAMFGAAPQKVVDVTFDDGSGSDPGEGPPASGDGDEAAGGVGGSPSPAAPDPQAAEPPPMPPLDEPEAPAAPPELTEKERVAALDRIWKRVAKAGMAQKTWGAWVKTNTGKGKASQITREDLQQLETAAEAYASTNGGGQ